MVACATFRILRCQSGPHSLAPRIYGLCLMGSEGAPARPRTGRKFSCLAFFFVFFCFLPCLALSLRFGGVDRGPKERRSHPKWAKRQPDIRDLGRPGTLRPPLTLDHPYRSIVGRTPDFCRFVGTGCLSCSLRRRFLKTPLIDPLSGAAETTPADKKGLSAGTSVGTRFAQGLRKVGRKVI